MNKVQAIHSPKVFKFSMRLSDASGEEKTIKGDARNIIFEPTCHPAVAFHVSQKKVVILVAVTLVVATAVACSVAIPLSVHHHHHVNSNEGLTPFLTTTNQSKPPTSIQIPRTGFTLPVQPESPGGQVALPRIPSTRFTSKVPRIPPPLTNPNNPFLPTTPPGTPVIP